MIILLDADILVYRVGFASDDKDWSINKARMDSTIDTIKFEVEDGDEVRGWLTSGKENFRLAYSKTQVYKGQRPARKPTFFKELRDYLQEYYGFKLEIYQEADDAIGIAACANQGNSVIVTIDKDLDNVPGYHYNFVKDLHYDVTPEQALRNFYRQMLVGDRTDNIRGVDGVGPVSAERILGEARDAKEYWQRTLEAYGQDEERATESGILLWIRHRENEIWTPPC